MILLKYEHSHEIKVDSKEWHHKEGFNLGAKAQLKKVVGVLKDNTVKAWGGNRVILSEDWEAILKEAE